MENDNTILNPEAIDNEYKTIVEQAIQRDLDMDIPNSTFQHAFFLTTKLLEGATKQVRILSGSLNEALYGDKIKNILKKLVERNISIKIIVWHQASKANIESLKELGDKLQIKLANLPEIPEHYEKTRHFLVADEKAYRLEDPHVPLAEKAEFFNVKGIANFNRQQTARVLNETFDAIWLNPSLSLA